MLTLIQVYPNPEAAFETDFPVALLDQSNLTFTNLSLLGEAFYWDFGDGSTSVERDPRHNYTRMGRFDVVLVAETEHGCRDTAMMAVEILPKNVFTPNAFRPGSEIAENRSFMPVTLGVDPGRFHMQVFGRWGQLVFESFSLDDRWDGKLRNGSDAPMGNYVWRIDYHDIQGFPHTRQGQVLLVR